MWHGVSRSSKYDASSLYASSSVRTTLESDAPLMVSGRSTLPSHMSRQDCPGWLNCQQTLWMRTPPSWQWSRTPIIESGRRNAATIVYNGMMAEIRCQELGLECGHVHGGTARALS